MAPPADVRKQRGCNLRHDADQAQEPYSLDERFCACDSSALLDAPAKTVKEIQKVYGTLVKERDELRKRYAVAASELRRIGEVLKVMGSDLICHPETIRPESGFDQDMADLRKLLNEYMKLSAAIAAKDQEIASFFGVR